MVYLSLLLIALFLDHTSDSKPIKDNVDIIELNVTVYPDSQHRFEQFIYWEWNPDILYWDEDKKEWRKGALVVVDWRRFSESQTPVRDWKNKRYISTFYDDKSNCMRVVAAKSYRKTMTNYDPEVQNRRMVSGHSRRKLSIAYRPEGE